MRWRFFRDVTGRRRGAPAGHLAPPARTLAAGEARRCAGAGPRDAGGGLPCTDSSRGRVAREQGMFIRESTAARATAVAQPLVSRVMTSVGARDGALSGIL